MRTRSRLTKQVEESAEEKVEKRKFDTSLLIPSGITLLNCACTDDPFGAFLLGQINTFPGGSVGGKSMAAMTMMAETVSDKRFNNYELIYDDGEETIGGFDIVYLFDEAGKIMQERIKPPQYDEDTKEGKCSDTIQDFKGSIIKLCKESNTPFIYVLDSLDSLSTDEEIEKEYKIALAKAKSEAAVKELKGSYKTEKAKHIGEALRIINGHIKKTKSALFIIQQERDKINAMFGKKTTTSGGHAPFYYSFHQVWFKKIGTIPKKIGDITYKIGSQTLAEVTKNKLNGKTRKIEFDIYDDYGIDDIVSCIDFLVKCKYWKKDGRTIKAKDLNIEATKSKLIDEIEKRMLQRELQKTVGKAWNINEELLRLNRRRKFGG